jgi:hypothetical protein
VRCSTCKIETSVTATSHVLMMFKSYIYIANNMINRYTISINYKVNYYKIIIRSERRLQSKAAAKISV